MPDTDSAEFCFSEANKKIRKRRSRSSSPRRGSATSNELMDNNAIRIDVYLALALFAVAIVAIRMLPRY